MDRNWQCEKTEQNQRCKEALDKVTTTGKPTNANSTVPLDYNHTNMMKKNTGTGNMANDDSTSTVPSQQQDKGQEENGSLRVVIGSVTFIAIILVLALLTSKRAKFFRFSREKQAKLAGKI